MRGNTRVSSKLFNIVFHNEVIAATSAYGFNRRLGRIEQKNPLPLCLNLCLDGNIPNFGSGAVVDAYIATERLSQIDRPEWLRQKQKTWETDWIRWVVYDESVAVTQIGVDALRRRQMASEQGGGSGIVGEVLAGEKIERVNAEGWVDVEGRLAESHHPEGERVRSLRRAGAHPFRSLPILPLC